MLRGLAQGAFSAGAIYAVTSAALKETAVAVVEETAEPGWIHQWNSGIARIATFLNK
jgi:hypothetical protein